jgi:hypothetical protein
VTNAYESERDRLPRTEEGVKSIIAMYYTFDENTAQLVESSVTRYSSCAQRQEEVRLPQHDLARHDHRRIYMLLADHSELDHAGSFTRSLGQPISPRSRSHKIQGIGAITESEGKVE